MSCKSLKYYFNYLKQEFLFGIYQKKGKMRNYINIIFTLFAVTSFMTYSKNSQTNIYTFDYGNNKEAGNYITIYGAKQYYEIYGKGAPLVLIHGNGGNIAWMKP